MGSPTKNHEQQVWQNLNKHRITPSLKNLLPVLVYTKVIYNKKYYVLILIIIKIYGLDFDSKGNNFRT
jgi:hypothetical protein